MSSRIVLIGPLDSLPGLQERLDPSAEVESFPDSEALEALDHIIRTVRRYPFAMDGAVH